MKNKIIIGTRKSRLALWQANHIAERLRNEHKGLTVELKTMTTKGDRILDVPLAKIGGKGLFTKELETEILAGKVDLAVHSLKDMPTELPEGLTLAALTTRAEVKDAFVSEKYNSLAELPKGARVGTSSLRRKAQLLHLRPDLEIADLRGNVDTRLKKLKDGEYDAIILAAAGLTRLGLADAIKELIPTDKLIPAVGQGILAIEAREGDEETLSLLKFLNDEESEAAAKAERAFLARVEGGCQVPVGVHATVKEGEIIVGALIASLDGKELYKDIKKDKAQNCVRVGEELAEELLNAGGRKILNEIGLLTEEIK